MNLSLYAVITKKIMNKNSKLLQMEPLSMMLVLATAFYTLLVFVQNLTVMNVSSVDNYLRSSTS